MKSRHGKVIRQLEEQGFCCRITRRQHVQVSKDGQVVTVLASTPSDHRTFRNAEAQLRRAGYEGKLRV